MKHPTHHILTPSASAELVLSQGSGSVAQPMPPIDQDNTATVPTFTGGSHETLFRFRHPPPTDADPRTYGGMILRPDEPMLLTGGLAEEAAAALVIYAGANQGGMLVVERGVTSALVSRAWKTHRHGGSDHGGCMVDITTAVA